MVDDPGRIASGMLKKESSGRMPTYKLKVKDEKTSKWLEVGAGWKNGDGSISVRLNACVVLDARLGVEPVLFLTDWEKTISPEKTE